MNAPLWVIEIELTNALPLSEVTLERVQDQYRFHVFHPDEQVTHIVAFNQMEFDACDLSEVLHLIIKYEVIETLELAAVALEIICRLDGVIIMPIHITPAELHPEKGGKNQ